MLNKILMTILFTLCACTVITENGDTGESEEILWAGDITGEDYLPYISVVA
jgi:hypothetical protein